MARKKTATTTGTEATNGAANGASRKRLSNAADDEHDAKRLRPLPEKTDYSRWRLRDNNSCQSWVYLEDDEALKEWPQSTADKYFLGLPLVSNPLYVTPARLTGHSKF